MKVTRLSKGNLVVGGAGVLAIQLCFAGLVFLNSFILARILGADGYGAFANAMAWTSLLVIPASFGFGTLLVRQVALYHSTQQWPKMRGILRFSTQLVFVSSVLLGIFMAVIGTWLFSMSTENVMRSTMMLAAALIPLFAILQLRQATLRGLDKVLQARIPELVVRPLVLLILVITIYFTKSELLSAPTVMAFNILAAIGALVLGDIWVRKALPRPVMSTHSNLKVREWFGSGSAMLIFSGSQASLMQMDIVMLGIMRGAAETGQYAIANRITYMLAYITIAADMVLAPTVARLYAKQKYLRLQYLIPRFAWIALIIITPIGIGVAYYGDELLSMFGSGFESVHGALVVLIVGRVVEAAIGSSPLLSTMSGHERITAIIFGCAALVNVVLNIILIQYYGAVGAAIASMTSIVGAKLALRNYLKKHIGIDTSILNYRRPKKI